MMSIWKMDQSVRLCFVAIFYSDERIGPTALPIRATGTVDSLRVAAGNIGIQARQSQPCRRIMIVPVRPLARGKAEVLLASRLSRRRLLTAVDPEKGVDCMFHGCFHFLG